MNLIDSIILIVVGLVVMVIAPFIAGFKRGKKIAERNNDVEED